jgi:hypothetical protein
MSTSSNLYAEKVFSEHPIALWALDDKADYLSLITESQRSSANWQKTDGALAERAFLKTSPFPTSITNILNARIGNEAFSEIVCVTDDIINFSDMNHDLKTFSIGTYFYSDTAAISGIQIGYEYYDTSSGQTIQHLKSFSSPVSREWTFISETFDVPDQNTTMRIVIKINYFFTDDFENEYNFSLNGLSLGQWSEEFNSTSLGVSKVPVPLLAGKYGVAADSYGLTSDYGYYIVSNGSLVAKNTGIPLVYGASGITKLVDNGGEPCLVIPAKGFLHESGKHKDYTFEMWLRVTSDSTVPRKIFGKPTSDDGLWVDGTSFILKINNNIATHYVGEWGKPMLIDIVYGTKGASLLLNGEEVCSIVFDSSSLVFPESEDGEALCFYSYEDVSPVEIDAVAIYSYKVPPVVAKRRFVYGQGVDFPENINTSYSGSSVFIDYQYADYTNNYTYPDLGKWNQGVLNNLVVKNNKLSVPDYKVPELVINNATSKSLTDIVFSSQFQTEDDNFFTLKPSNSWSNNGYLKFDGFNILQEDLKAFYIIIKPTVLPSLDETIIHIEQENTSNYFSIVMHGSNVKYNLFYNGQLETIYSLQDVQVGESFTVGMNIEKFADFFGKNCLSFFGNRSSLKLYVGGTKDFTKSFHGKIYRVGLCNAANLESIKTLFNSKGSFLGYEDVFDLYYSNLDVDAGEYTGSDPSFWQYVLDGGTPTEYPAYKMMNHIASYTLIVKKYFGNYYFDIAVKSSWKDYLPLSYLSEYVKDANGEDYYDLDFIQFNIDYPAPSRYLEVPATPVSWRYGVPTVINPGQSDEVTIPSLSGEYSFPIQRNYDALGNQLFTGYNDYEDLKNKVSKTYKFDTSSSFVKSYINFEYVSSGINTSDLYFTKFVPASTDGVVSPESDWMRTKYEVVDSMVIYPPKEDTSKIAMVTRLEFEVDGILTHNIKIKTLEYSSQAFNDSSPNPVGTRFGTPIYPYRKSGYYYNYKSKNPFTIYKKSSPYLFLTRNSGITLRGNFNSAVNRGLSIPVNQGLSDKYSVIAMQAAVRLDQDFFPYSPTPIFEVESKDQYLKFFIVANSSDGKRGTIYAINARTGQYENGILFYLNGKVVKDPVLTVKEWAFLGISFSRILNFNNVSGAIRITGPLTFNVLSYYQSTSLQETQQTSFRKWFRVKYAGSETLDWKFWTPAYRWGGMLVLSSKSFYGVDPDTIYKSYTGTNKIIIDTDKKVALKGYEYNFYQAISWQQSTSTPV